MKALRWSKRAADSSVADIHLFESIINPNMLLLVFWRLYDFHGLELYLFESTDSKDSQSVEENKL